MLLFKSIFTKTSKLDILILCYFALIVAENTIDYSENFSITQHFLH